MNIRPVLPLIAAIGLIGSNALALSPIATLVAQGLGSTPGDVIVASAAYGLGTAGAALLLAPLADRTGPAVALFRALVLWLICVTVSAAAPNVTVLIAAQALAGIAVGMALPAIYSLAAERAAPGDEARTIGMVLSGWMVSMVFGVAVSAFVADAFGWRMVYGGLAVLGAVVTFALRPKDVARPQGNATSPLTALNVPGIGRALFSVICLSLGFYGSYSYIGTALQEGLGATPSQAGLLPLTYGAGFGTAVLFDKQLDRIGARRALPLVALAIGAVYLSMALSAASFAALLALAFAWGIFQHFGLTLTVMRLTALDPAQRGAIMGLNSTMMYLGVFGGALLFRPAYEGGGLVWCLLASMALTVLMAIEAALRLRPQAALRSG